MTEIEDDLNEVQVDTITGRYELPLEKLVKLAEISVAKKIEKEYAKQLQNAKKSGVNRREIVKRQPKTNELDSEIAVLKQKLGFTEDTIIKPTDTAVE